MYNNPSSDQIEMFNLAYKMGFINTDLYPMFLLEERGIKGYTRFFNELIKLENDEAILWHCTDGKDRTGLASMLILSILDAPRELILNDYTLTNEFNAARLEVASAIAKAQGWEEDKKDTFLFMSGGVIENFMVKTMDLLEEKYGSVKGYVKEELHVSEEQIEGLKEKFME